MTRSARRVAWVAVLLGCALVAGALWNLARDGDGTKRSGRDDEEAAAWIRSGRNFLDWGDREQAVAFLRRALRVDPDEPRLLADLATALLLESERASPADLVEALEYGTRALELDAGMVSACSARARALARLFLRDTARETIERCFDLDVDPRTADELRTLRDTLAATAALPRWDDAVRERLMDGARSGDERTVRESTEAFPDHVRRLIEDELLATWATALLAGRHDDARAMLPVMARLGEALRIVTGDRLAADAVAVVLQYADHPDPSHATTLARAHDDLGSAAALVVDQDCARAEAALAPVRAAFERYASPFRHVTGYWMARCHYEREAFDAAETELLRLRLEIGDAAYPELTGRLRWQEGLTLARRGRFSASLQSYDAALEAFAAARDETDLAGICRLIAETLDALGRYDVAWRRRLDALARLDRIENPRRRHQILYGAAMAASRQSLPRAAIAFEAPGVASARRREAAIEFIAGAGRMATFLHALGRDEEARPWLDEASRWLDEVAAEARPKLAMEIDATAGAVLADIDPSAAVQALDRAIAYCKPSGQVRLATLYPLRGRANLDAGRLDAAENDLRAGIEFFERAQRDVFADSDRISYRDVAREVYDEMIRFQVAAEGRPDVALEYAERARARLLLQRVVGGGVQPMALPALSAPAIVARTPPGTALVYFTLLEDRLLTSISAGGTLNHAATSIDTTELTANVNELRVLLELGERPARARELLEGLYDLLIRPIAVHVADVETLIVLPDKALHMVPFAALVDTTTNRYLIQDHALGVALSATLLLTDLGARDVGVPSELDALIVANPTSDIQATSRLSDLSGAEEEARRIGRVYDDGTVLLREEATRARFLERLGRTAVVHFAGHALPSDDVPLSSRLLLAPDPDAPEDDGVLYARDLYGVDMGRTQIVVLASCETASGTLSTAEGAINLARPFLAAGVPATIATLWRIDDAVAPELFGRFHEGYRANRGPLFALRDAQLAMARSAEVRFHRPSAWAATEVFLGSGIPVEGGEP